MSEPTEEATPRRLERARREGDGGASVFASRAAAFFAVIALLPAAAIATATWFTAAIHEALAQIGDRPKALFDAAATARALLGLTAPLLLALAATTAAATFLQTGGVVAPGRIAPRWDRVDVVRGFGQVLSTAGLLATVRAMVYGFGAIGIVVVELESHALDFAHLTGRPEKLGPFVLAMTVRTWEKAAALGLAVAAIDLVVTRMVWRRRLRMTKEEVARERRESSGDPQIKEARARAFEALVASSGSVNDAALVVSDGRRAACALRYDAEVDAAPKILAIGRDLVRLARENDVPIEVDPELTAALTKLDVGFPIPEALYDRVGELLANVPARSRSARNHG